MGEGLYETLVREQGYQTRIYAPVGGHRDLLAYLVRRLLENGANSSFVHQLADERLSDADLIADPVAKIAAVGGTRHPAIPLPGDLFAPERPNSRGIDLQRPRGAGPGGRGGGVGREWTGGRLRPAKARSRCRAEAEAMVSRALAAFPAWDARSVDERAACLERLADLLERERDLLMRIAVQEASKTIPDALAEVREAVDFCRYYAAQARKGLQPVELPGPTGERNVLRMDGRGVLGVHRALELPARHLPRPGRRRVGRRQQRRRQARPADARDRRLRGRPRPRRRNPGGRPGPRRRAGPTWAQPLVEDGRIAGIAFTGSTATAKTDRPRACSTTTSGRSSRSSPRRAGSTR